MSPRAYTFCRPERKRGVPKRGVPRRIHVGSLGTFVPREDMDGLSPRALFCHPEPPFFVTPRRQPRGPSALSCLGMTKRGARLGMTKRGARLGMTKMEAHIEMTCRDAVPNEVRRDAVPSEARDASLTLGTTIR